MHSGGPLSGLRVIEMAAIGPVPHCGMVLSDLGADVVRLDRETVIEPLGIAVTRSADFLGRGKRARPLPLKRPEGLAAALAAIAEADIVIEGFRPGVMERLGLGPDVCLARNPRLVYGRISGWGDQGPLADAVGHDLNFLGVTGALAAMGAPGLPPPVPLNIVGDFGGGAMQLAVALLAAVLHARASGQGQVVATSIFEGTHALMPFLHGLRAAGVWEDRRHGNPLDGGAPFYRCYEAGDGRYLAVAALEPKFYRALVGGLGLLDRLDLDAQSDRSTWAATGRLFRDRFLEKERDEWAAIFTGTDACVSPVLEWQEAATYPQAMAMDVFDAPGGLMQPRTAARFSVTPAPALRPPP